MTLSAFKEYIATGYPQDKNSITFGCAIYEQKPVTNSWINIPLKSLNRHGLICGATGTGKTKTIQMFAELLSENDIPSLLMDIKGDLSGMAFAGTCNEAIKKRQDVIGLPFEPRPFPVELLKLSDDQGVQLRATVSEFGPTLLAKILELNETQESIISVVFKYCDDHQLPLLDIKDLKKILSYLSDEENKDFEENYGYLSPTSINSIVRKVIALEQEGADQFFGEPSFDVADLLTRANEKDGKISILELSQIQDKSRLFSSFMLCLLAEIYHTFPEVGDLEKPKLVIFIDEAHMLFKNSSKALIGQLEQIIRLIRSKGVGIFFCTQNPTDISDAVLSQLGMKIQHALRAFTAKDRKELRLVAHNYPDSPYYDNETLLTSLGIGEIAISVLSNKGYPTPLAAVLLRAPRSRMGPLTIDEKKQLVSQSLLTTKYNTRLDRKSAYEILNENLAKAAARSQQSTDQTTSETAPEKNRQEPSTFDKLSKNTMVRQMGRTIVREITRGLLGILGIKRKRR
ncbi:helicase HerA-like domain-containing protein [Legionella spiritensis]|uniref:Putative ATPase n=1 Tax=Legionella spiritensis TaxID=452 RepID=A0A0W0Z9Y7_LEGSP|nr:helicase HerA-like domain-containing protein [Legionella spiritensis]KTD65932.1 putative ATPase [Legionella spiritensis]SNV31758.1 putative ATPase [Legionella spiritensis]VEG92165.1 putative ATPase [Legionella spiritensis]